MDNIPLVPAGTCGSTLFRRRCAEYQALDLLLVGSLGQHRYHDDNNAADNQHGTAEEQPVEVVEYSLEPTIGSIGSVAVVHLGTQTGVELISSRKNKRNLALAIV